MKKTFTGGLGSLLGEQPKPANQEQQNLPGRSPRGRPVTNTRVITKTSQEGTKEGETRATFIVQESILEALKDIAYWERVKIKDVVSRALAAEVAKYKAAHKTIKPRTQDKG